MIIPRRWNLTPVELDAVRSHPHPRYTKLTEVFPSTIAAALDMDPAYASGDQTDYLIRLRDALGPGSNLYRALDAKVQCFKKALFHNVG